MEIRAYAPEDADELAALFRRNHYGPDADLDGRDIDEVLRERVPLLCLVAVEEFTVHGCLAACSSSGRRCAGRDEGFVGLFVIDRGLRNSSLAGKLFVAFFSQIVTQTAVRRLRVEVNPANRKALPLYLRVGFRALPGVRADEDGYIELVSDLSGLVRDLSTGRMGATKPVDLPSLRWRPVAGGRGTDVAEGVRTRGGRTVVTQTVTTDDLSVKATMDFDTGQIVDLQTLKGRPLVMPERAGEAEGHTRHAPVLRASAGPFLLRVAADGELTVSHGAGADEQVLIREMWPVEIGERAPGQRRQPPRCVRATSVGPARWRLECPGESLTREVSVDNGVLRLTTTPSRGRRVLTKPWIAARKVELGLRGTGDEPGAWRVGPLLQGLWPSAWTDFEAACPTTAEAACIDDGDTRLLMTWAGRAQVEARTIAALSSLVPGEPVSMTLSRLDAMPEGPCPDGVITEPPSEESSATVSVGSRHVRLEAVASSKPGLVVLEGSGHRLKVALAVGVIDWVLNGKPVLTGSYPAHSVFGALAARRAGLWCVGLANRNEPDQGLEWAPDTESLGYDGPECPLNLVDGAMNRGTWRVRASESGLEVSASTGQWPEAAVNIVPLAADHPSLLVALRGRCYALERDALWRGAVDGVGIPLADGRILVITGAGRGSEVFVRSLTEGVMTTVLAPRSVRARLRVLHARAGAVRLLEEEGAPA